jgi:cytochrome c
MKRVLSVVIVGVMIIFFAAAYLAAAATAEEAKDLAEKAAADVKMNGKDKAIAEISNPRGQFVKGDLYVVLDAYDGTHLANGGNPKLAGMNLLGLKDPNGKLVMKEMIEVAKTKGSGWVEYSWTHPANKKIQKKLTYVKRVEGTDMYVAAAYENN